MTVLSVFMLSAFLVDYAAAYPLDENENRQKTASQIAVGEQIQEIDGDAVSSLRHHESSDII